MIDPHGLRRYLARAAARGGNPAVLWGVAKW